MTPELAQKLVARMRESGYLLPEEYVEGVRTPTTDEWAVELWSIPEGASCGNARQAIFRSPEDWTAFATMRGERRIGMAYR